MTHYIRKSHLRKLTFALCIAALCLCLIGAFAYAADGDSTVAPVEVVGLVADSNYMLADGYWRANGGTGDYAFYQGMSIADAKSRIAGVEVKMSDGSTSVLPIGNGVTITLQAADTGNSSVDNVTVPFAVELTLDGADEPLTATCDVNFIAEKPYALEWVSGAPDTSSLTLTSSTSVANLANIGISDAMIRLRLTSGKPGDSLLSRELIVQDSLAPSGSELPALISQGAGAKYNKTISIAYARNIGGQYVVDSTVSQLQLECVNISYDNPTGISDALQGSPAIQTTKTVFNFSGLKIRLKYPKNATADIALSDIQNYITRVQFENAEGTVVSTDKNFLLTTLVKAVTITVEIPTSSGTVSQEFYVEFNVNQNVLSQPSVDNLNPTYEDGGVTVTISNIFEDDGNPIAMSVSGGSVTDNTITFDKGGVYTLTLTLTNGTTGDYVWALAGDGQRDERGYVLTFTITVSNAPVDVALTYTGTNGADREYGDNEPAHFVALSYADGGNEISSGLSQGSAADDATNNSLPSYELRYYPASGTTLSADKSEVINDVTVNYTTTRPTSLGTYYVYAATGATDKYAAGRSTAVVFTISPRKLYTSGLTTAQPYKEGAYTVDDFVNISSTRPDGTPMFASGDKVEDVINIPTTKFTHVSDSVNVDLTIKSSNYVWASGATSESVEIKITKVDMSFTVSQPDLNYGDKVSDNLSAKNISTLKFGVTIDDTQTKYEKFNGTTWTTVTAATNTVWDAGSYRVTYYTKDKAIGGTGGSEYNKDYNWPSATDTFEIHHGTVSKVDITNWTDDNANPYLLGVYGTNYTVTLNRYLANNTSPAGAAILASTVTGVRLDGTTVITTGITDAQTGTVTINQAGVYTVTIKLNSNYKWTDGTNDDIVLYGKIAKQTVSNIVLSESNTTYDGANHDVNVTFVVGSGSASWAADSLNGNANIVKISSITGSKYAAAVLAATVTPNETAGVIDGSFTVKYAGDYVVDLDLNDTNNYEWAQGATTSLTYAVAQAMYNGLYDYTDPYPFVAGLSQQFEPTFTMTPIAANDTATDDVTAITPIFTLYGADGTALSGNKVIEAGTFYKVVTSITSADSSYLNYYVPAENKDTVNRKVSVEFVVSSAGLDKIDLDAGGTGATISGSNITVTYKHSAYKFSDFVSNWSNYCYTSGGTTIPYLDITVTGVSGQNPELTKVKIESDAVASYVVKVKPATNYEWEKGQGLTPDEEVTFYITIDQLAVVLQWNNTSKDYSDNATTTVDVTNAGGDKVSVNYVYVNGSNAEVAIADIKNAAAGNYTLSAKSLAGADAANYSLTGCSNASDTSYTIYKKGVAKPATAGYTGAFNDTIQTTAGLYSNASALNTSVFTANIQGVRPASWFGTEDGIAFDTTDTAKYALAVTTGAFTFCNAGVYSVTFTITDSANYFWQGDGNASDFTYSGSGYTCDWTNFASVARADVSAPVLGANRAMEWTNVADLSTVFTGSVGSISYGVQYGVYSGSTYGEPQNVQAGGIGSVDSSARGEYYALLTINGDDKFNYVWTVSAGDNEGSTYVTTISKITFTSENGAQVYLHYAITASQLPVFYQLKLDGYVFGANGVSIGSNSITALGIDDLLEMTGADADVANAKTDGTISYAFYKTGTDERYAVLVNGLPWEAGTYDVRITIAFAEESKFSTMTIRTNSDNETLTFEVSPRAIEVEWSFGDGDGKQTGTSLTSIYNNANQTVNAVITNMPKMSADDDTAAPTLTLTYNGSATAPKNATTYNVAIDEITGTGASNFTKIGSSASDLNCTFVINPYAVTVTATGVSDHIYGNAVTNDEKTFTVTSDNKFFGTDANNIKVQIWNADLSAAYATTNNVGMYKVVPTWNGTKPALVDGAYVINAGNYTVTVALADFEVVARQIAVTFNAANATSVYGETVDLYRTTKPVYSVTWTNKLDTQNDSGWLNGAEVTTVFTLSSDATTTNKDVGLYDVTLAKVVGNDNYVITVDGNTVSNDVVLGQYGITNANITITSVAGYTGTYDNAEHAMFPTRVATTVNNQTVSWYYQDVNATDKDLWTLYALSNPATVKNVSDSGKYYIKVTAPNHNDVIYNTDGTNNEVTVTISKATIKVKINLSIWYGEQAPASLTGGAYKATVAELTSNANMYTFTGLATGENIATISGVTGDFSYTTTYTQGDNAGDYDITFVPDTLTADNYVFVNNDVDTGVLTVNRLALTVTVDDISTVYYSTKFEYTLFSGSVHVGLPKSTYNGATLAQADLHADVWNKIYNSDDVFEGAQILDVTTTAYTSMLSDGVTKAVDEYSYTCGLKTDATNNYSLTSAVAAKHTITNADLVVLDDDINGYSKPYDESQHSALTKTDGSALTTFATSEGGMAVNVLFIIADATDTAYTVEQIAAWDWANDGVSTMPTLIDVCNKVVYFRIGADNHNYAYGQRPVSVSIVDNVFANESAISFADWIYGLYDAAINPNGYNAATYGITDAVAKFSRKDGVNGANKLHITLTRNGNAVTLDKTYEKASEMFAYMWANGLFAAGKYSLTITMDGTPNYNELTVTKEFTVAQKQLTVTSDAQTLTYGDDAPEFYGYVVTGFVNNGLGLETQQQILGDILNANGDLFTSDYQAGRLNGFAGTHSVYRYTDASKTTVADGLNDVAETDNYTLLFVDGAITVNKREVIISIDDAANRYNLSIIADGAYTTQTAATYNYALKEGSSFFDDDAAFEIHTEAMTSLTGKRTNNAGAYPIYVRWLTYKDNNNDEVSYSQNYTVKFEGCSYDGAMPADAITQDGVNCAGTYTIEKAELIVNIIGPLNDDGTSATNGLVYSNTRKNYKAEVAGGDDDVEFTVTYYNGHSTASKRDSAPTDVGNYRIIVSTDNNNYVAQTTYSDITITSATVVVGWEYFEGSETVVAQIEYGTRITALDATKSYPSNARFTGLTYTYASEYFEHDALISLLNSAITKYSYTTSYDTTTAPSDSGVRITPVIEGSPNFAFTFEYGTLQVIQRKVIVRVDGYDNGNPDATSPYTGKSPFDGANGSWNSIKSWFTAIDESDAYVNGHSIASLGITLEIDGTTVFDASETAYKVNVNKGTDAVCGYYNVKFVVGDGTDAYYPSIKPTYLITKKAIKLIVKDQTVTYGNTINANLAKGFEVGALSNVTFVQYFEFDEMLSTDRFDASGSENNVYKFDFEYTPYVTGVGDITLSVKQVGDDASTIKFTNYEVTTFVAGKITVNPRVITASTEDQIYTEVKDGDGNKVYNNGVYGAAHNAVIEYDGHKGTGYFDTCIPTATLTYTTVSTGLTAAQAPTKVGAYKVNVTLTNQNYIYDTANSNVSNNGKTLTLNFNVNKQTLNPSWIHSSIQNTVDTDPADLQNYIADYVQSIMEFQQFQKTAMDNIVTDIHEGTDPDSYRVGAVGSESVGLYLTVVGTGEYRVTLTLTEAAQANYQWVDNASSVTLIFNVATDKVTISSLTISGWIYGEEANQVAFTVSNENNDGVQVTYARVPQSYRAKPSDSDTDALKLWYKGLTYSASIPTDAGDYAVRAYYPAYAGVNGDEKFASFIISKATMATPTLTVADGNSVFNGEQLTATLTFDTLKVRINNYNGTTYSLTSTGATIYATDAGSYTVTFSLIDGDNYQWGSNASSETWVVDKATNNEVTFTNSDAEKSVVYGNRIAPKAEATYNGVVYFRYMAKTSDVEPERNDTNWLTSINKFVVGEYWVMAVNSGNSNYNGDYAIATFEVTKSTLTLTPTGSMTYGEVFSNSNSTLKYEISGGRVQGDNADDIITVIGTIAYELVDATDKLDAITYGIVLKSDANGVIGLSADNYKIVSATGEFTVNKRDITVTLGNASSQYGREINLNDITVNYGKDGLVAGDSLNIEPDTHATASSVIGGYAITASYDNDNYNVTVVTGVYTITERRIIIEMVAGGGVYGEAIAPVKYAKVLDDANVDITEFVKDKLTLSVVYSGTAIDGTICDGAMPTHAGTYLATVQGSNNVNFVIVGEPFTQFVVDKKVLCGSKITIANQTYTELALEPVIDSAAFVAAYSDELYDVLSHADFVNVGNHTVTLRLKDANNYKWQSVEVAEYDLTFTIDKANNELVNNIVIKGWIYGEYDSQVNLPNATVKFGQGAVTFVYSDSIDGMYHSGAPITGDVGEYYVRVTVPATDNYNAFESNPVKFAIRKKALVIPALTLVTDGEGKNDVYTGDELLSTISGFDMALMNLNYEGKFNVNAGQVVVIAVNAGMYTVTVSIRNTNNYYFANSDEDQVALTWTIAPKAVAKPAENTGRFMVNGQILTYIPEGFDEEIMTIDGNQTAYGGEFPVTVGLKDKDNYVWAEGGVDDFTLTWNVVGINTVFYIVVGVLGGASGAALIVAGVQLLLDRRRRLAIDNAIDERSKAEAEKNGKTDKKPQPKNDETNQGGND